MINEPQHYCVGAKASEGGSATDRLAVGDPIFGKDRIVKI